MSILDIPELANLLASYLSLLDLSICIRVSKSWNYTFVPHIWHIIPPPASIFMAQSTHESAELLRLATRSDFLAAQQQPQDSSQGINNKAACSATTTTTTATVDPTQDSTSPEPTEQELLLHLLKYCPNLQSLHLDQWSGTNADLDFWRTFARDVVPSLVQFRVEFTYQCPNREKPYTGPVTVSIPPILIDKCSSMMNQLTIPYTNVFLETSLQEQEQDQDVEAAAMVSISNEAIEDAGEENEDPAGNEESLELAECTKLRRLEIDNSTASSLRLLADALRTGLPNVDEIEISYGDHYNDEFVADAVVASVLSANRKGWRNVSLPTLDTLSSEALVQHSTTLESLQVRNTPGFTSAQMCQILSTSPYLHTFMILSEGECVEPHVSHILAEDFIDLDPVTNSLRPWPCVSTLKLFRAKILGIPRPDITQTHYGCTRGEPAVGNGEEGNGAVVLQETHSGQGRELQAHVYERLSSFTRLKVLGLGHDDRDFGNENNFVEEPSGAWVLGDQAYQYECLEMSLDSGLQKLETLKDLEEVNVFRMATCVGVQEVKWMTKAWPRLVSVEGLNADTNEERAETWLRRYCPGILSNPCSFEL
ncbi:hypothetical protein KI688_010564 [Linnemannia hyalina]|uniref:F-box domain-containing protein n=1 Tax=Linnemannia hyalina TaxID=64524 RepID=A0A9P7XX85_9FUNG|nr:hypothetical protein KI688_010564 [Linnemannia hyalina]